MEKYVVIARFDDQTTKRLESLRALLFKSGELNQISEWSPHITFAAYESVDIKTLLEWTKYFAQKTRKFDVSLSSLGILPPSEKFPNTAILFMSPSPSKELIDNYYAFHEKLDEYSGEIGLLYTKKCVHPYPIHSTIGIFEISQIQKATEVIFESKILITAKIVKLEVYTYPMNLIQRFELT